MKVSLEGILLYSEKERMNKGGKYMLKELYGNLKKMKERKNEGEKVLDEFFNLYIFERKEVTE